MCRYLPVNRQDSPYTRDQKRHSCFVCGDTLVGGYVYVYLKLSHALVLCFHVRVVAKLLRAVLPGEEMHSEISEQEEKEDKQGQSKDK